MRDSSACMWWCWVRGSDLVPRCPALHVRSRPLISQFTVGSRPANMLTPSSTLRQTGEISLVTVTVIPPSSSLSLRNYFQPPQSSRTISTSFSVSINPRKVRSKCHNSKERKGKVVKTNISDKAGAMIPIFYRWIPSCFFSPSRTWLLLYLAEQSHLRIRIYKVTWR